jgi:hypothetical protein
MPLLSPPAGPLRGKKLTLLLAVLTVLILPLSAARADMGKDPTGVEGLAAFRGDFVPGAVVLAFAEAGPGRESSPLAVSAPTDDDGRYRLLLPAGKYFLVALKSTPPLWPASLRAGDLYCYYLGNPIPVEEGKMTRVGFNMIKVPADNPPQSAERGGIAGRVVFEDKPLGRSYVYVYRDRLSNFRGMGVATLPTDAEGMFRIRLAPGRYYLLARKRKAGGMFGPPGKDDHIGYYFGNPVEVREKELRDVTLEMTSRIDLLEELWFKEGKGAGWFNGRVTDNAGRPVPGLYVLFYTGSKMSGTPAFIAGPTDGSGDFQVRAAPGRYRLLARSSIGGPPTGGEWYGLYRGPSGEEEVEASSGQGILIVVTRSVVP